MYSLFEIDVFGEYFRFFSVRPPAKSINLPKRKINPYFMEKDSLQVLTGSQNLRIHSGR